MTTVVYYDLDEVTSEDVDRARAMVGRSGDDAVHLRRADACWSPGRPLDAATIPSSRSSEFRTVLEAVLTDLAARARRSPAGSAGVCYGSVDLVEVAWFDWFFSAHRPVHRAWALAVLTERFAPSTVIWVGDPRDRPPAAALADAGSRLGVAVHVAGSPPPDGALPWQRRTRRRLRGGLRRAAEWWRLLRRPASPAPDGRRPLVLLAEDFHHLATVLVDAGQCLRGDPALDVRFVASHPDVLPVAAPLQPVLLEHGVSRRARAGAVRAGWAARRAALAVVATTSATPPPALGAAVAVAVPELTDATASAWEKAARATVLWDSLLGMWRPRAVVNATYTGNAANRALLFAAASADGPCTRIFVEHGLVTTEPWKNRLIHDHYLVWGPLARRRLVEAGAPVDAVVVTGSAKLDQWRAETPAPNDGAGRVLYLPSRTGGRFVSFALARRMLAMVHRSVGALEGAALAVKVHPDDRSGLFDELDGATVLRGHGAVAAMAEAAVVVASTSTAGFEACALGRPLVVLAPEGVEPPSEYREFGAAVVVRDEPELLAALCTLLTDATAVDELRQGQQRLVAELFGDVTGGGAAARIAGEIARLTLEPRP